jgi:hypothetical protein
VTFEWSTDNSSWQTSTSKAGTAVGSPVTTNNATVYFNASGFDANVSGTYYVRAKGENAAGITYSDSTSFNPWTLKTQGPTNTNGSREILTVTPTGGSAQPVYIYQIAVVGGGGGAGYAGGGGGGTLNSYSSALVTDGSRTVTWTIGSGGSGDYQLTPSNDGSRAGSGGTTSIAGTNTTISAAGGQGAQKSSPSSGQRSFDGGGSTGYSGGGGRYDLSGKSAVYSGGGGAGSGGNGGVVSNYGVPYNSTDPNTGAGTAGSYIGGDAGASATAHGLTGGGGGSGSGSSGQGSSHSDTMHGKGGNGLDPNAFGFTGGLSGNSGAIIFKYYGP